MAEKGFKRRLTAILSADAVEYSRLMGDDEEATIRTITEYRKIITEQVKQNDGRVVDSPGDNVFAEFASVVDALKCAVQTQSKITERNDNLPENREMKFRIGVNLGDIAEDGDRIYGDGVNVAARIESLAEPGGICISRTAYDQVKNKLELGYEYLGEHSVKNITEPVRVYKILTEPEAVGKVIGEKRKARRGIALAIALILLIGAGGLTGWYLYIQQSKRIEPASIEKMAYPLPDKPSIAVLPFVNMSDDPKQEYFSDGITENIITDLSKISAFFVISRSSTYAYKGKPVKIKQVSEELGVRYVLEGSVQKSSDKVRINAQLVDAITGHHLWAERYDRDLKDIFAVQDEITQKIVRTLRVEVTEVELERIRRIPTENLNAYESFYRGLEYYRRSSKSSNIQARQMFEKAIELDPRFSVAYVLMGHTYRREWLYRWSQDPQTMERAFELAQKAIELNDSSIYAYELLGYIYLLKDRQHEQAIAVAEKVIALDPNFAGGYGLLAEILGFAERPEEVIGLMEKAMRLNPRYPAIYLFWLGNAHYQMGRYDEAIAVLNSAVIRKPNHLPTHLFLAASYVELGREEEARAEVADISNTLAGEEIGRVRFKDLAEPKLTKIIGLGVFLAVLQQWCGINVIFNYAQEVFQEAGYGVSDMLFNVVITGVVNLVATFVAIRTVDRLGRKALMLMGAGGLTCFYGLLGAGYYMHSTGIHMLLLIVLSIACYAMTLAPVTWVLISELFPNRIRGAAMSVAVLSLWIACTVLTLSFPYMKDILGAHGAFWTFGCICVVGFVVIFRKLPETKGKTLEAIERELVG